MKTEVSLHHLLQKYMHLGWSHERIFNVLGRRGFTHDQIEQELTALKNPQILNDVKKLKTYFSKHLKQGHDLGSLVEKAVGQGIDPKLISQSLSEISVVDNKEEDKVMSSIAHSPRHLTARGHAFSKAVGSRTFRMWDALLLIPVSGSVVLSFYNPLVPFAAIVLVSIYLLRVVGVNPKVLGYTCLIFAVTFWMFAVLYVPGMLAFSSIIMFLLAALLLFLP